MHIGESECLTPKETKRKRSLRSDIKLGKKLHLGSNASESPKTSTSTVDSEEEENMSNSDITQPKLDRPTPDQVAFEDRLIAKFSNLMTEKLKPLEDSIKALTECQKQHSNSIKEITNIQAENIWLHHKMEGIAKENTTLRDRLSRIENKLLENSIMLTGVPEEPWELESNLHEKVVKILAYTMDAAEYEDQLEVAQEVRISRIVCKGQYSARSIRPVLVTFDKHSDASYVLENRYYLPQSIFVEREYTEETEQKRKILRPYLCAARNINHYVGRCRISGDKLIVNSRKYSTDELDQLPEDLSRYEISTKCGHSNMCFFGELNPLLNFHKATFTYSGKTYHSSEQFIQKTKAEHFGENRVTKDIMHATTPLECKRLAREITRYDHQEWSNIAKSKCEPSITSKFQQNPVLMNLLLSTGDVIIAEATYDKLWGTGVPLHHDNALN